MTDRRNRDIADGRPRGALASLPRRVYLTYKYRGPWSMIYRAVTFPLRFTPMRPLLRLDLGPARSQAAARRWYRRHGRRVTVVIPSYRDPERVMTLVAAIRRTTDRRRVRIIVSDDASGMDHVAALRRVPGIEIVEGQQNSGFAANVNRALRVATPDADVVIVNSDVIPRPGWLDSLQYASTRAKEVGVVGPKLLYPDGLIQFAGTVRNLEAPEWFDHRYRFRSSDWGPANVPQPVIAVTGACMYIKREVLDRVGELDERYPMAYEDVDYCLRAWEAGYSVIYWPSAVLYHLESITRGVEVGERERASQRAFWKRWGEFFDARNVYDADSMLRVIYVTEDTGIGGGHRDVFEHVNGLSERGHHAELWTLGDEPDWFDLRAPVRTFDSYDDLVDALEPVEAIKVATWWNTASPVWIASLLRGIPVYFVQDIETTYYPDDELVRHAVLASYRHEFRYMTISSWNQDRLRELRLDAVLIPPGIDLGNFRPLPDVERRGDMIVAIGRSNPLKNLPLTLAAWRTLPAPRPELCLFGIEPELDTGEPGIRYEYGPRDSGVNRLLNEATVFLQTSTHEGFCLPALEAMATGAAVVCTDAHGNRDFCRHERNCLVPDPTRAAVAEAIARLLSDADLRARLGAEGIRTAADYAWPRRIDALESYLIDVATPRKVSASTNVVPGARRRVGQR